jgi:CRP/FNR family cyclic AMP-dependent transcriptional regulator
MHDEPLVDCSDCPLGNGGRCPLVSRRVAAGTTLWGQGDVPRELVLLRDGLVSLTASDPTGHEVLSSVRGARALLGLEALRNQPAHGAVDALTDVQLCSADPNTVRHWAGLAEGGPATLGRDGAPTAAALLNLALDELERTTRDLDLRSGPALSRVARFLLASSARITAGRQAPFSKQHVARLLGIRPETMSRCLTRLQAAGLITSGRRVAVLDHDGLTEVARGQH